MSKVYKVRLAYIDMEISDTNREESERTVYRKLCTGEYIRENYHTPIKSQKVASFAKNFLEVGLKILLGTAIAVGSAALLARAYDKESEYHESHVVPRTNTTSDLEAETLKPEQ